MRLILNNNLNNNSTWQNIEKKIQNRRSILESNRKLVSDKTKKDFDKIFKREKDFTSLLVKAILPIEIEWDEEATEKLKQTLPFTIKFGSVFDIDNDIEESSDEFDKIDKLNLNKNE
jgi:hypothetical protein